MSTLMLNADVGESFGSWKMGCDEKIMPYIELANVACGFHASDPDTMRRTVRLAVSHHVMIGAHPAYPDLVGFGRRSVACSEAEIENLVLYQIGALAAICRAEGTCLSYVKPHGALYNDMMRDPGKLAAVMRGVAAYDASLPLMVMATRDPGMARQVAGEHDITLWFEAFADRTYDNEGRLVSRREPGSVHHDPVAIVDQAMRVARGEALIASDGSELILSAQTLCVHGDNPESVAAVKAIREALDEQGKNSEEAGS